MIGHISPALASYSLTPCFIWSRMKILTYKYKAVNKYCYILIKEFIVPYISKQVAVGFYDQ